MEVWFARAIVGTGRLPLFCFFVGLLVAFLFIRCSTRMIRARIRWWPGNLDRGGLHIHHVVFGVVISFAGGLAAITVPGDSPTGRSVAGAVFGVGSALVLDEFALILRLEDVYWTEQGRISVDAVVIALAVSGMLVLGVHPLSIGVLFPGLEGQTRTALAWALHVVLVVNAVLAVVTLLKGKLMTGLIGLAVVPLLYVGAIRLARPVSPWARWRYPPGSARLTRARRREERLAPVHRAVRHLGDLVAGRPDRSDPGPGPKPGPDPGPGRKPGPGPRPGPRPGQGPGNARGTSSRRR
jgi:hypothetical protein